MLSITTTTDLYFQLLRGLPAAVRAALISRLAASLLPEAPDVDPAAPVTVAATVEADWAADAGFGGWRDTTPDDYAEQIRAARTPNTRPIPEW